MRSFWSGCPAVLLLLSGCDSGGLEPASDAQPRATVSKAVVPTGTGTVLLRLEKMDGVLIEGFALQVRLEGPAGHQLLSSSWQDLLRERTPEPGLFDAYRLVVSTPVPAGPFVVTSVMHPGMESVQPECVSRGQVQPGGVTTVTLKFWPREGCSTVSGGSAEQATERDR